MAKSPLSKVYWVHQNLLWSKPKFQVISVEKETPKLIYGRDINEPYSVIYRIPKHQIIADLELAFQEFTRLRDKFKDYWTDQINKLESAWSDVNSAVQKRKDDKQIL